jgi:hypothetical protein
MPKLVPEPHFTASAPGQTWVFRCESRTAFYWEFGISQQLSWILLTNLDPVMVLNITDNMCDFIQVSNWRYRPSLTKPAVFNPMEYPDSSVHISQELPTPHQNDDKILKGNVSRD